MAKKKKGKDKGKKRRKSDLSGKTKMRQQRNFCWRILLYVISVPPRDLPVTYANARF